MIQHNARLTPRVPAGKAPVAPVKFRRLVSRMASVRLPFTRLRATLFFWDPSSWSGPDTAFSNKGQEVQSSSIRQRITGKQQENKKSSQETKAAHLPRPLAQTTFAPMQLALRVAPCSRSLRPWRWMRRTGLRGESPGASQENGEPHSDYVNPVACLSVSYLTRGEGLGGGEGVPILLI